MSVSLSVAKAVRWTTAGRSLAQIVRWAITLVVIRILAPEDYGLVALAIALLDTVGTFYEMGLAPAIVQAKTLERDDIRKIFGLILLINFALCAICLTAAPWIAALFDEPRLATVLQVLALMFPIAGAAAVPFAILRRNLDFKSVTILNVCAELCGAVLTLALAVLGFGVWALVYGHLFFTTLGAILVFLVCPIRCLPKFSFSGVGRFVDFGGIIVLQRLVMTLYGRADVFIIGRVFNAATVGVYSVALEFGTMPLRKIAPIINEIAFAGFSKIQEDRARVAIYLEKAFRYLSMVGLPIFGGISCVAPELTMVVLGPKWRDAVLPLQLMSLVVPLRMFGDPLQEVLNGIGQARLAFQNTLLIAISVIIALLIGVQHGIFGVCVAWLISLPLAFSVALVRSGQHTGLGLRRFLIVLAPPLFACVVMYVAVLSVGQLLPWPVDSVFRLLVLVGTGGLAYCGTLLILRPRDCLDLWLFVRS